MLRIATFNVLFGHVDNGPGSWSDRRPLMRRTFETARADILGLQEVFPSKLDDVAALVAPLTLVPGPSTGSPRIADASLPFDWVMRAVRSRRLPTARDRPFRSERMQGGEHQPIAYRADRFRVLESGSFWISANPGRPGSMLRLAGSPFLVHWARLEALGSSERVLYLNAHFGHAPWHHAATARIVTTQLAALERDTTSVFLVGDFNAGPSSGLVRQLTSPQGGGFTNAARAAPERAGPPVTFHWGTGSARFGLTLDYVLARTALRPTRSEVFETREGCLYPSFHHLLLVEFGPLP